MTKKKVDLLTFLQSKTNLKEFVRQGDVPVDKLDVDVNELFTFGTIQAGKKDARTGLITLAYGEVSGHAHVEMAENEGDVEVLDLFVKEKSSTNPDIEETKRFSFIKVNTLAYLKHGTPSQL